MLMQTKPALAYDISGLSLALQAQILGDSKNL